ncbi:hypothetical protein MASR2M15_04410 [Anaerolineales bacterium]
MSDHNKDIKKNTDFLDLPSSQSMPLRRPTPQTSILNDTWTLEFVVDKKTVVLPVKSSLLCGRKTREDDGIDFDLALYGAYHLGVSRQHAVIKLVNGFLYIEDLNSTNGTRINGFQLLANQQYRLRNNDEVEFGRLRTVIRFVEPQSR